MLNVTKIITGAGGGADAAAMKVAGAIGVSYDVESLTTEKPDATLIFVPALGSGHIPTMKECLDRHRPYFLVRRFDEETFSAVVKWFRMYDPKILQVTGNTEAESATIFEDVFVFLIGLDCMLGADGESQD